MSEMITVHGYGYDVSAIQFPLSTQIQFLRAHMTTIEKSILFYDGIQTFQKFLKTLNVNYPESDCLISEFIEQNSIYAGFDGLLAQIIWEETGVYTMFIQDDNNKYLIIPFEPDWPEETLNKVEQSLFGHPETCNNIYYPYFKELGFSMLPKPNYQTAILFS